MLLMVQICSKSGATGRGGDQHEGSEAGEIGPGANKAGPVTVVRELLCS